MASVSMGTTPSSSSTLWATASKEWVIQPKPKPGRKPKKDTESALKGGDEVDLKGRRVQNRAAQRAFRERKQSQLVELQARLQSYEQGEMERSVALQNVAKRLKEENEKLRQENLTLQAKIKAFEQQQKQPDQPYSQEPDKKRWREEASQSIMPSQPPPSKKSRVESGNVSFPSSSLSVTHLPSPASMASTPDPSGAGEPRFSSLPYDPPDHLDPTSYNHLGHFSTEIKTATDALHAFSSFGCGFCAEGSLCVCQEIAVQQVSDQPLLSTPAIKQDYGQTQLMSHNENEINQDFQASAENTQSILDNLPEYQPPLPLRRRTGTSSNPIFRIDAATSPQDPQALGATCSGDPTNCMACADDSFGKAFCAAIGNSTPVGGSCADCPNNLSCVMGDKCCKTGPKRMDCSTIEALDLPICSPPANPMTEFITTNDAWQKLKQHPNVEFADLSLLAEVVASRTRCSGPRLVLSSTVELVHDLSATEPDSEMTGATEARGMAVGDGERAGGRSPPPRLVPQEILLECGRRNLRHVNADGVREALRLLDAKFS